jgi:hypothetical protein
VVLGGAGLFVVDTGLTITRFFVAIQPVLALGSPLLWGVENRLIETMPLACRVVVWFWLLGNRVFPIRERAAAAALRRAPRSGRQRRAPRPRIAAFPPRR